MIWIVTPISWLFKNVEIERLKHKAHCINNKCKATPHAKPLTCWMPNERCLGDEKVASLEEERCCWSSSVHKIIQTFFPTFSQKVQFWVIPISLGVLDIVKAGAQRLELVRYTWGLYDPGPGTGSGEEKLYQSKVHISSLVQDYSKQKQILQHKYSKQSFQQTID